MTSYRQLSLFPERGDEFGSALHGLEAVAGCRSASLMKGRASQRTISRRPYYRVEASRNRDPGGTGLGLAIAKNIAELHGGRIELKNRLQGGLAAVLLLPRHRRG